MARQMQGAWGKAALLRGSGGPARLPRQGEGWLPPPPKSHPQQQQPQSLHCDHCWWSRPASGPERRENDPSCGRALCGCLPQKQQLKIVGRSSRQEARREGQLACRESAAAAAAVVAGGGCRCGRATHLLRSDGRKKTTTTTRTRRDFRPSFPVDRSGDKGAAQGARLQTAVYTRLRVGGTRLRGRHRRHRDSRGGARKGGSREQNAAGERGAAAAGGSKGACRGKRTRPSRTAARNCPTDAWMEGTEHREDIEGKEASTIVRGRENIESASRRRNLVKHASKRASHTRKSRHPTRE